MWIQRCCFFFCAIYGVIWGGRKSNRAKWGLTCKQGPWLDKNWGRYAHSQHRGPWSVWRWRSLTLVFTAFIIRGYFLYLGIRTGLYWSQEWRKRLSVIWSTSCLKWSVQRALPSEPWLAAVKGGDFAWCLLIRSRDDSGGVLCVLFGNNSVHALSAALFHSWKLHSVVTLVPNTNVSATHLIAANVDTLKVFIFAVGQFLHLFSCWRR